MQIHRRSFLAAAAASLLPFTVRAGTKARVVVVGGGFGGATAAKYLRRYDPSLEVTLVEREAQHVTCPFSNAVIGGLRDMPSITHSLKPLERHGVKLVRGEVVGVDPVARKVSLGDGKTLPYDRLVLSPGVDFRWGAIEGYDEAAAERAPHAWKAGRQTRLLRHQLEALPDGGVVALAVPGNPFRCPPGPYERASLIAHFLKAHKPRSKVLILDGKDGFSKQGLFQDAWAALYPGLIEWVPLSKDGKVVKVDAAELVAETEFGTRHKVSLLNVIPPQQAGRIAQVAGVTDESGWVPVKPDTFESAKAKDIYVVGDAAIAAPMPKSGFSANSQAKVAAAAIVSSLHGVQPPPASWANTCYSLVAPDYGITVTGVYRVGGTGIEEVQGSGGVSRRDAPAETRRLEARYADGWYDSITADIWG